MTEFVSKELWEERSNNTDKLLAKIDKRMDVFEKKLDEKMDVLHEKLEIVPIVKNDIKWLTYGFRVIYSAIVASLFTFIYNNK